MSDSGPLVPPEHDAVAPGGSDDDGFPFLPRPVAVLVARSHSDRLCLRSFLPDDVTVVEAADPARFREAVEECGAGLVLLAHTEAQELLLEGRGGEHSRRGPLVVAESATAEGVAALIAAGVDEIVLAEEPLDLVRLRMRRLCRLAAERRRANILREALQQSPHPVFISDASSLGFPLVVANQECANLIGAGAGADLGLAAELVMGPETDVGEADTVRLALWKGQECTARVRLPGGRSAEPARELRLRPLRTGSGKVSHWIGFLSNLAGEADGEKQGQLESLLAARTRELADVQQRLDARRRFIETVLDSLSAGVIAADVSGVIVLANRSALSILDLTAEQCLGVPVRTVFARAGRLESVMREAAAGERRLELEHVTPGGKKVELGLSVTVVGAAPRLGSISGVFRVTDGSFQPLAASPQTRYVFVFRDLGVQRQFELEMRRVEGLSALGQMATAIAHEIRNPLAAIRSLAETLQSDLPEGDEKQEYASRILSLLLRIERIVRNSLRFARPRAPEVKHSDAMSLVEDALEVLQPRLGKSGGPRVLCEAAVPRLRVDPDQIVEVLVALVENALDAATGPAGVEVRVGLSSAAAPEGRPFVMIELLDDGPGIPAEIASRVFEPFFTTKPRGTGLGLSIAQRLVRDNGGHLHVQRRHGPGTSVRLLLPSASP